MDYKIVGQMSRDTPTTILVCICIIFGISVRILGLFIGLYDDAGAWMMILTTTDKLGMNFLLSFHPPLGLWVFKVVTLLVGTNQYGIRFVPLLFGLLSMVLIYMLAVSLYSKPIGLFSVIAMMVTYFPFWCSTVPDTDTTVLSFSLLAMFYLLRRFLETANDKMLYLVGISYGACLLSKFLAVVFILPVVATLWYETRKPLFTIKSTITIGMIALSVFGIFPMVVFLSIPEYFVTVMKSLFHYNVLHSTLFGGEGEFFLHPKYFLTLAITLTPLYLGFVLWWLINLEKKDSIIFTWFFGVVIIYIFLITPSRNAEFPRYYSVILPPLVIISGRVLGSLPLERKHYYQIIGLSVVFTGILFCLNMVSSMDDRWCIIAANTLIQTVSINLFVIVAITSLAFFIPSIIMAWKAKTCTAMSITKWFLTFSQLFLAISLSFNFFLIGNSILSGWKLKKSIDDIVGYYRSHPLPLPIYSWNEEVPAYLGLKGHNLILYTDPDKKKYAAYLGLTSQNGYIDLDASVDSVRSLFKELGGTILLLHYPYKHVISMNERHKEMLKMIRENCLLLKQFIHDGELTGEIYQCPSRSNFHRE